MFSAVSVEAGLRENMIMARVPKHYKQWTTVRPEQPYAIKKETWGEDYTVRFELVEASYIVMEGIHTPARKLSNGNKRKAYDSVRFGWKVTLRNLSDKDENVYFYYRFFDTEGFRLCSVGDHYSLAAGETKTFQQDSTVGLSTLLKADAISCTLTPSPEY